MEQNVVGTWSAYERKGHFVLTETFEDGPRDIAEVDSQGWFRTLGSARVSRDQIKALLDLAESS